MKYQDRIVVFIDVLGFKSMVDETVDKKGVENPEKIQDIYDAYEAIQNIWEEEDSKSSKKASIFSDSIIVSVEASAKSEIFFTLLEIKHLIMSLVWRGILVRGAVVRGKLIHERGKVFGPALIEAYLLEAKAALYPRIILDRDLVNSAGSAHAMHHSSSDEVQYVQSLLEKDSDGMYYVDYFFKASRELDDPEYDFPQYINALGEIIRKGLMGSTHHGKADVRVKYSWMRERYNKMVDTVKRPLRSIDWEDGQPTEIQMVYGDLKKISPKRI